jgi:RNA polymerase sigma-70 factor (ECF subfamily)
MEEFFMSYNYGKEVRNLLSRQAQEDAELRESGVSEEFIEILHEFDLSDLKADRAFYMHNIQSIYDILDFTTYAEYTDYGIEHTIITIEELLDNVDNPMLHKILMETDKLTLETLLLKMQGYSVDEIALGTAMNTGAVYQRLSRIRKKIRLILAQIQ